MGLRLCGGVVTRRPAKPITPVQFWAEPPVRDNSSRVQTNRSLQFNSVDSCQSHNGLATEKYRLRCLFCFEKLLIFISISCMLLLRQVRWFESSTKMKASLCQSCDDTITGGELSTLICVTRVGKWLGNRSSSSAVRARFLYDRGRWFNSTLDYQILGWIAKLDNCSGL